MNMPEHAAERFVGPKDAIVAVEPHGSGIIHNTYLVKLSRGDGRFILQRMNTQVFKNPELIMHNLQIVGEHVRERTKFVDHTLFKEWQVINIIPARDGRNFFIDPEGGYWRALSFIRGASPLEGISSINDALEVGRALGAFHWLLSDLAPRLLHDTLPGFHNVEQYLGNYDAVLERCGKAGKTDRFCLDFIATRRSWAPVLEEARRRKTLQLRIMHGDPKMTNIMIDNVTRRAVSIIDLDTVMPGLVQYDIGDCLRSCCNIVGEETADISAVRFDPERCRAVLSGYVEPARNFLTGGDLDFFFDGIRLLPFELGLRFYTDFLENNVYFKVSSSNQNLDRARVQFKLVESIEEQEEEIREIIEAYRADLNR
jgi:Ser/Thr protein kinase RdoA (MazF antagonist)